MVVSAASALQNDATARPAPVSIWRTYFVANEWNEIQTVRKTSMNFQLFALAFILVALDVQYLATDVPSSNLDKAPINAVLRFAVATSIWLGLALVQLLYNYFIYERFVEDKIGQFSDLCSVSNVSVFVMEEPYFGHYLHGRSVHGYADTDMWEMNEQLRKEEEDLCGHRGLLPNSENQSFEMHLPTALREHYDRVFLSLVAEQKGARVKAAASNTGGGRVQSQRSSRGISDKTIQAYLALNRFLAAFIDHALKEVDYVVKDKLFLEQLVGLAPRAGDKGVFYNEGGHAYSKSLFYGNEWTLLLLDIMFYSIVDLIFENTMVSIVVMFVFDRLLCAYRNSAAESNLAKKTLVDKRFLI
eukprot:Opistho-2@51672